MNRVEFEEWVMDGKKFYGECRDKADGFCQRARASTQYQQVNTKEQTPEIVEKINKRSSDTKKISIE